VSVLYRTFGFPKFGSPFALNVLWKNPINPTALAGGIVVNDLDWGAKKKANVGQWVQCLMNQNPAAQSTGELNDQSNQDFDFDQFFGQPFHIRNDHIANSVVLNAVIGLGVNGFPVLSVQYLASKSEWIKRNLEGHFIPPEMKAFRLSPSKAAVCLDNLGENYIL
jgi:hypothetical protein